MNPNPEPVESPTASPEQRPVEQTGLAGEVAVATRGTALPAPRNRQEARATLAQALPRGARKRRQQGAVRRLILMGNDGAIVLRGDGRVQTHTPRGLMIQRGTAGYWTALFRWILSATDEEADDRRQVLMEHFEEALMKAANRVAPTVQGPDGLILTEKQARAVDEAESIEADEDADVSR